MIEMELVKLKLIIVQRNLRMIKNKKEKEKGDR